MIPLVAQLPAPEAAQSVGWIALALVCLVGGINQVLRLTDRFREHPPTHQTYATKVEHKELETKVDAELGRERGARKSIHEQIAALQSEDAALKQKTAAHGEQLAALNGAISDINDRIDAIPQRTIALLNETKQLHRQ
jgi:hypothetical protein